MRSSRLRAIGVCVGIGLMTVACTTASPGEATAGGKSAGASSRGAPPASASARTTAPPAPPSIVLSEIKTADGSLVTVAVFRGSVQYVLHNGSVDPGAQYDGLVQAGPVVTGAERHRLLAVFNGGFLMRSRAGGYEQEGHVLRALRHGFASLVLDHAGHARIGVWGQTVPAAGEAVFSVRQNLWPLVQNGQPTAEAARWWRWGGTIGHAEYVARSAAGQDVGGDLIYAASMSTVPQDLAEALARSGAVTGMELDINPEWVQLDTAASAGGALAAAIPGQVRPADQYLNGWTRDFITVLAPAGM